jgi:hypothetical protein
VITWRLKFNPADEPVEVTDVRLLPPQEARHRTLAGTEAVMRRAADLGAVEFTLRRPDPDVVAALHRNRVSGKAALLRPEPGTVVIRIGDLVHGATQQLPDGRTVVLVARYRAAVVSEHDTWL